MDQKILREYLIALGFKIDQTGEKRVESLLGRMDKKAGALGKGLLGVATTVVVAATAFARSMEKMFYASRYADTTVENLQALEYGARSIGLEAGKGGAALKNMAAAIRSNPGLVGLLNSLGVEVKGRDKADVMLDLVGALKKMPFYVAERYANLFGIDQETLFNLQAGLDKMKDAQEARKSMAAEMGYDADKAAETAKEYMGMWREVTERAGMFGMVLGDAVLPYVKELVGETNTLMIKWAHIVKDMKTSYNTGDPNDPKRKFREGLTGVAEGDRVTLTPEAKARLGLPEKDLPDLSNAKGVGIPKLIQSWERWREERAAKRDHRESKYAQRVATDPAAVDAVQADVGPAQVAEVPDVNVNVDNKQAPPSVVRVQEPAWQQRARERIRQSQQQPDLTNVRVVVPDERAGDASPGGRDDFSPVEPPPTRAQQRTPTDPKALEMFHRLEVKYALPEGVLDRTWAQESDRGRKMKSPKGAQGHMGFMPDTQREYGLRNPNDLEESAEASARKWSDLMKRYKGDQKLAAAAYNWGDGNLAKVNYDLTRAPRETQEYAQAVGQGGQNVTIEAKPEIHIHGVSNAGEAASKVVEQQRTVNADVIRNFSPKVR